MPKGKGKPIHTVPNKTGGWDNKKEGTSKPIDHSKTKKEAVTNGRDIAKENKTEHIIHDKDGKISEKNSYGNDPCPPKDKK